MLADNTISQDDYDRLSAQVRAGGQGAQDALSQLSGKTIAPSDSSSGSSTSGNSGWSSAGGSTSETSSNPQTGTTGTTASRPAWMGNMYRQDANGYWSTNPDNPNAERFFSDGRPVATVGFDNQKTGFHYNGLTTPEQFQTIQGTMGHPDQEENLIKSWLASGALKNIAAPNPVLASANTGSTFVQQLTQAATNPMSAADIQRQMQANSAAWNNTTDPVERQRLHDENIRLGALIGATYNPSGAWSAPGSATGYDYLNNQGQAVSRDGSLNLSVNGQPGADVPVYQGTAYGNLDDISKRFGVSYNIDTNGRVTVNGKEVRPIGFDSKGIPEVGLRDFAQAAGLGVDYDNNKNTITITGSPQTRTGTPDAGAGTGGNQGGNQPGTGASNQPGAGTGTPQDATAAWTDFFDNQHLQMPGLMPIQQSFNPDWTNYYNQSHAQIDPLYQSRYDALMGKQTADLRAMDESMNRRGIYTSGIAEAAANDLRAKTSNSVASLFAKQMSDIEKTAQGLEQQAYKQYSQGNQFALKYNKDQMTNYLNQQKQIFGQWLQTQKLNLSQLQYALNAWDKHATMLWNQYKFDHLSANQQATQSGYYTGPDGKQYPTLQNSQDQIRNAMQYAQLFGFDQSGKPTLKTFEMLGYIKMPDGSFAPTEKTTNDQRNYALNLGKALGYVTTPDGKIVPTEQTTHDRATENLAAQKLTADIANNRQNFALKYQMDMFNIQKANDQALDQHKQIQLSGLRDEMTTIASRINSYVNNNQQVPQTLVDNYNTIKNNIEKIISPNGFITPTSTIGTNDGNFDANNPF